MECLGDQLLTCTALALDEDRRAAGCDLGDEVEELYHDLGDWFKSQMQGWNCWIISSNNDALKLIGLKPSKKFKIFNGELECSFRQFEIFGGRHKDHVVAQLEPKVD